jgi:hypothetical protein
MMFYVKEKPKRVVCYGNKCQLFTSSTYLFQEFTITKVLPNTNFKKKIGFFEESWLHIKAVFFIFQKP